MPSTNQQTPSTTSLGPAGGEGVHASTVVHERPQDLIRRQPWADARFGVIVHWGISSALGGLLDGERVEGLAEWIQFKARIPGTEYARLAGSFNPTNFNAREWVRMAHEAGARYFVYTAKHHDGFAMYHSAVSDYNIVDATPFGRDPLAELAQACAEYGIMLGLYYSQTIDWEDPDAVGPKCNDWDFDPAQGDFHTYWRRKAMPQLRELLTDYGDIGLLWFDMPSGIPADCAREAYDLVRELQPAAVINSRLGGGVEADYISMDDNYFNNILPSRDWETAATTNDSWGYAELGDGWKPVDGLCEALAYTVSRGGNLLLNIGPDATGAIPPQALDQFAGIGQWMHRAAPGIHAAGPSPFPGGSDWGHVTSRGSSLYLHVADPGLEKLLIPGLVGTPADATDLATGTSLQFSFSEAPSEGGVLGLELPEPTDGLPRTIELVFTETPAATGRLVQTPGADLRLDLWTAARGGDGSLRWNFTMSTPGQYRVVLLSKETFSNFEPQWWADGLTGTLVVNQARQEFTLRRDGDEPYPIIHYWKIVHSDIGSLEVSASGEQELSIEHLATVDSKWDPEGVNMIGVRLVPVDPA